MEHIGRTECRVLEECAKNLLFESSLRQSPRSETPSRCHHKLAGGSFLLLGSVDIRHHPKTVVVDDFGRFALLRQSAHHRTRTPQIRNQGLIYPVRYDRTSQFVTRQWCENIQFRLCTSTVKRLNKLRYRIAWSRCLRADSRDNLNDFHFTPLRNFTISQSTIQRYQSPCQSVQSRPAHPSFQTPQAKYL